MPHGSKLESVAVGLSELHEVVVVAQKLELEQELELVLMLEWALMLALNLMICEWASMIVAWKVEKVNVSRPKLKLRPGDVVIECQVGENPPLDQSTDHCAID